ncbi:MAG: hypothetical protein ABI597_11515 [Gammaproteobacteria bacterium]
MDNRNDALRDEDLDAAEEKTETPEMKFARLVMNRTLQITCDLKSTFQEARMQDIVSFTNKQGKKVTKLIFQEVHDFTETNLATLAIENTRSELAIEFGMRCDMGLKDIELFARLNNSTHVSFRNVYMRVAKPAVRSTSIELLADDAAKSFVAHNKSATHVSFEESYIEKFDFIQGNIRITHLSLRGSNVVTDGKISADEQQMLKRNGIQQLKISSFENKWVDIDEVPVRGLPKQEFVEMPIGEVIEPPKKPVNKYAGLATHLDLNYFAPPTKSSYPNPTNPTPALSSSGCVIL